MSFNKHPFPLVASVTLTLVGLVLGIVGLMFALQRTPLLLASTQFFLTGLTLHTAYIL
jgi:hypothetical protein